MRNIAYVLLVFICCSICAEEDRAIAVLQVTHQNRLVTVPVYKDDFKPAWHQTVENNFKGAKLVDEKLYQEYQENDDASGDRLREIEVMMGKDQMDLAKTKLKEERRIAAVDYQHYLDSCEAFNFRSPLLKSSRVPWSIRMTQIVRLDAQMQAATGGESIFDHSEPVRVKKLYRGISKKHVPNGYFGKVLYVNNGYQSEFYVYLKDVNISAISKIEKRVIDAHKKSYLESELLRVSNRNMSETIANLPMKDDIAKTLQQIQESLDSSRIVFNKYLSKQTTYQRPYEESPEIKAYEFNVEKLNAIKADLEKGGF